MTIKPDLRSGDPAVKQYHPASCPACVNIDVPSCCSRAHASPSHPVLFLTCGRNISLRVASFSRKLSAASDSGTPAKRSRSRSEWSSGRRFGAQRRRAGIRTGIGVRCRGRNGLRIGSRDPRSGGWFRRRRRLRLWLRLRRIRRGSHVRVQASRDPDLSHQGLRPMSSSHSCGCSRMKLRIKRMHAASCRTSTATPRDRSRSSSPRNVSFSPTITLGMP